MDLPKLANDVVELINQLGWPETGIAFVDGARVKSENGRVIMRFHYDNTDNVFESLRGKVSVFLRDRENEIPSTLRLFDPDQLRQVVDYHDPDDAGGASYTVDCGPCYPSLVTAITMEFQEFAVSVYERAHHG